MQKTIASCSGVVSGMQCDRGQDPQAYSGRLLGSPVFSVKGDLDRALANYDQAIKLRPEYGGAFFNRASVYAARDELEHALTDYDLAIRHIPDYSDAYKNRGVLKLRQGDARAATWTSRPL